MMKIGMVFPAQGSQFVGMGKELYDDSRIMQEYFEQASNCLDINFVKLCFASSDAELNILNHTYTALFLVSSALYAVLKEQGIEPSIAAGYNVGEYAAMHAAGSLSLPDGLYLLNKYANFYQEFLRNVDVAALRVHGIAARELKTFCVEASQKNNQVSIAIYESATHHIVTGDSIAIMRLRELLGEVKGIKVKDENVQVGLHSELMLPVVEQVKMYLEKVDFRDTTIPLIINADAKAVRNGDDIKQTVLAQIHKPVLWAQSVELLADCELIIEVGPGKQLSSLLAERYPDKQMVAINTKADIEQLKTIMGE